MMNPEKAPSTQAAMRDATEECTVVWAIWVLARSRENRFTIPGISYLEITYVDYGSCLGIST